MTEESLFAVALEKPDPAAREAFLAEACGGDMPLRQRLEQLLAAHGYARGVLDRGPDTDGPRTAPVCETVAEGPGTVVGRYRLREQIGVGGFGLVFVAEQTEPVRRRVALKLIKPGMDTREVVARFEAERQALALMDHPNIAQVFDAGATDSGRPYFVMELVRGVAITEYCDRDQLPTRGRLGLFVDVCRAVQHAHQKGVIHRDLKPGNVLVTRTDSGPVVKVIDFGVAKALYRPLTDRSIYTGFAQLVGTPLYMSPEQAELSGLDIDTRADVYALGVLLYELLTGMTPFDKERLKTAGLDEIRRIIREEDPPRPSTRVSTLGQAATTVSANRQTDPGRLSRALRGDLDWIVMRCLEKDRTRRYATASELGRDVERYLADEPVLAGPPSAGYRLRKFVRRNRGRVAVAAALAVLLFAGTGAVLAVRADARRDRAARESWTTASVAAALGEARARVDEAWGASDHPDRMRLGRDAARGAVRRADDYAAGGAPTEAILAELAATRQAVDELDRHTRLITAADRHWEQYADELNSQAPFAHTAQATLCERHRQALREFGLDPIGRPVDEVAAAVAGSRVRDSVLGMLLEWQDYAQVPRRADPAGAAVKDRLGQVIRAARRASGGPHARWQDLLDRNDVPGLVAFAASPDGLSFRSGLVGALGRDLRRAREHAAGRAFLRAAVDRYPEDVWLRRGLAMIAQQVRPPDHAEALRHMAAASALRPDNAQFHAGLGSIYLALESYDHAAAAYRKAIALRPESAYMDYTGLANAMLRKQDLDGAIAAFRGAVRVWPDEQPPRALMGLVSALMRAGRYPEALEALLAAFRRNPGWAEQTGVTLRYDAARAANNCADGRGVNPPPPAERPGYRKQALDLLTAELAALEKVAVRNPAFAHERMGVWLTDKDLASVREPTAGGQLPPDKRDAWNKLWADARGLRDRTAPPAAPPQQAK